MAEMCKSKCPTVISEQIAARLVAENSEEYQKYVTHLRERLLEGDTREFVSMNQRVFQELFEADICPGPSVEAGTLRAELVCPIGNVATSILIRAVQMRVHAEEQADKHDRGQYL